MSIAHLGLADQRSGERGSDYRGSSEPRHSERTPPHDLLAEQSALGVARFGVASVLGASLIRAALIGVTKVSYRHAEPPRVGVVQVYQEPLTAIIRHAGAWCEYLLAHPRETLLHSQTTLWITV